MILFAALAGMALIVVLCVLIPLLRPSAPPRPRAEHDVEIYRDQLAEVERDRARGLVTEGQLEASRTEIGRRLLAADAARRETTESREAPHARAILAAVLAALLPLAAGGLYVWQGAPPGPAGPEPEAADARPAEHDADMTTLVERLAERMKERPDDARGWRLLGRSLASLERFSEAAGAYGRAAELLPADADLKIAPGRGARRGEQGDGHAGGRASIRGGAADRSERAQVALLSRPGGAPERGPRRGAGALAGAGGGLAGRR